MYLSWLAERRHYRKLMEPDETPSERDGRIQARLWGASEEQAKLEGNLTHTFEQLKRRYHVLPEDMQYFPIVHIDAVQMEGRALALAPGWRWEATDGGGFLAPPGAVLPRDVR